jgi:sulfate permease, SulP family
MAQHPGLRHVVLMMSGVNDIDFTGLEGLVHLARDLKLHQVDLHLSELKGPVGDRLEAAGLRQWLTGQVFRTQHEAQVALAAT